VDFQSSKELSLSTEEGNEPSPEKNQLHWSAMHGHIHFHISPSPVLFLFF
jgi:hypothetical protein